MSDFDRWLEEMSSASTRAPSPDPEPCANCLRFFQHEDVIKMNVHGFILRFCCSPCMKWARYKLGLNKSHPKSRYSCWCPEFNNIRDIGCHVWERELYTVIPHSHNRYILELRPPLTDLFNVAPEDSYSLSAFP